MFRVKEGDWEGVLRGTRRVSWGGLGGGLERDWEGVLRGTERVLTETGRGPGGTGRGSWGGLRGSWGGLGGVLRGIGRGSWGGLGGGPEGDWEGPEGDWEGPEGDWEGSWGDWEGVLRGTSGGSREGQGGSPEGEGGGSDARIPRSGVGGQIPVSQGEGVQLSRSQGGWGFSSPDPKGGRGFRCMDLEREKGELTLLLTWSCLSSATQNFKWVQNTEI